MYKNFTTFQRKRRLKAVKENRKGTSNKDHYLSEIIEMGRNRDAFLNLNSHIHS